MENEKVVMEVVDFDQLRAFKEKVRAGLPFPRTFGASNLGVVGCAHVACLVGETETGEVELRVAYSYLDEVLAELLYASCAFEFDGHKFIVSSDGASIWKGNERVKFAKYKYDRDMALKVQKTQYKANTPFALVSFALDPTWRLFFDTCMRKSGWLAQAAPDDGRA